MEKRRLKRRRPKSRSEPSSGFVQFITGGDDFCVPGYTRLSDSPEVLTGIERIAELLGSMTIHLMENTDYGDKRIVNELSRKVDINPYGKMTRTHWMQFVVKTMLIHGNAIVYPHTSEGIIEDLKPYPADQVVIERDGTIRIGDKIYQDEDVLHFLINPSLTNPYQGEGYRVVLKDVVQNLKQATKTRNDFMTNTFMPSLIVKFDGFAEEFKTEDGRKGIANKYLKTAKAGEPWIVPQELIDVQQVQSMTLNDIAIADSVEIDKTAVANILGVPPFLLGVGDFDEGEYNNFLRTRVMAIAKGIEQELTKKLLLSPKLYFKMSSRSLYAYGLSEMAEVGARMYVRGVMTGNEVRDWLSLSPLPGLDELIILENFIPLDKIDQQSKLTDGGDGIE